MSEAQRKCEVTAEFRHFFRFQKISDWTIECLMKESEFKSKKNLTVITFLQRKTSFFAGGEDIVMGVKTKSVH